MAYPSLEEFRQAVGVLRELTERGDAEVVIDSVILRSGVRFEFLLPERALRDVVSRSCELTEERFTETVRDVGAVLTAVIHGAKREAFARGRSEGDADPSHSEREDVDIAVSKFDLASESFDVGSLKARLRFKATSQNEVLAGTSWEVISKLAVDDADDQDGLATEAVGATLRLDGSASDNSPFALLRGGSKLVVSLDISDVRVLIASLGRLEKQLELHGRDVPGPKK